ncbi:MAG: TetR/AcrR family transcriptional regulator [bacterium]
MTAGRSAPGSGPARQELLDRVVAHLLATGTATISLRTLAAEVGSSHRMLIYHFGGQDGLLHAVVEDVESRQRAALADLAVERDFSAAELSLRFWRRLSAPKMRAVERLLFQLQAQLAATGDVAAASRLTTAWLVPVTDLLVAHGYPRAEARRLTRLGLAVYRGLLLDLVTTGDQRAVNEAMRTYVAAVFGPAPC